MCNECAPDGDFAAAAAAWIGDALARWRDLENWPSPEKIPPAFRRRVPSELRVEHVIPYPGLVTGVT